MNDCWNQSREHRDYFIDYLQCNKMQLFQCVQERINLQILAKCRIRKKLHSEMPSDMQIPDEFDKWPSTLHFRDLLPSTMYNHVIQSLEKCIKRRVEFRNHCILSCDPERNVDSHDYYIKILQILRANMIMA
jgi:hypothetical protein